MPERSTREDFISAYCLAWDAPRETAEKLLEELLDGRSAENSQTILDHFISDRRGVGTVSAWQVANEAATLITRKKA